MQTKIKKIFLALVLLAPILWLVVAEAKNYKSEIDKKELINVFGEFLTDYEQWKDFEEAAKGYGYSLKELGMAKPKKHNQRK